MKKFLLLLFLVFISANFAFGQAAKKKTAPAPKAATKEQPKPTGTVPKLEAKEPSFIGFTGSFVNFGKITGNNRDFSMKVEYRPWFFEVSGKANASHNTPDLGEDVIVVIAYYPAPGKTADGVNYQAGLFDLMIYLDDEPIKISDLNFTMIGKATEGSTVLEQAKTWNFQPGRVFKTSKYEAPIIKAQAAAFDKADIAREEAVARKREADSIAKEKKRVADSIAKEEKRVADSIAKEKKRVADSIAKEKKRVADSIEKVEKRKKDSIAARKKFVRDSIEEVEQAKREAEQARKEAEMAKKKEAERARKEAEMAKKKEAEQARKEAEMAKKKEAAAAKKKKKVVEEDDFDDDDEPPPPKKKRKKKPVVEEEEPPVKKKAPPKKKSKFEVVDEDEEEEPPPRKKKRRN